MPYSKEQIGTIEVREINTKTKDRFALILVQHGREQGIDETHVTVLSPTSGPAGRRRSLEMIARGIDHHDIRFCMIPHGANGDGDAITDGLWLRPMQDALWWTRRDDLRAQQLGMSMEQYARHLIDD